MDVRSAKQVKFRIGKSYGFRGLIYVLAFACVVPLLYILGFIIKEGITKINWHFLVRVPRAVGETGGGISNALVGSILIVLVAAVIAIPIGVMAGIYLSQYRNSRLAYWSRLSTDVLQGVPSIVIGIIAYFWMVKPMHHFSGIAGSIALAIMMLPIIVRSTEETLKLLPSTLHEAAYALGMPFHRVIFKVIVPVGISGILSGVMLSVARISGETAPLLFTSLGNLYFSVNLGHEMESLPHMIYIFADSPYTAWLNLAWGASLVLLVWVLLLNIFTKVITRKWKVQF